MIDGQASRQFRNIALKWRALVERRRDQFEELYHSGRWKIYYTEDNFIRRMREVVGSAKLWTKVAPRPGDEDDQQPDAGTSRRDAA